MRVVSLQLNFQVIQLARNPKEIGRDLVGLIEPSSGEIIQPEISDRGSEIGRAFELAPDCSGPLDRVTHLWRRPSVGAHQGWGQPRQDCQLLAATLF